MAGRGSQGSGELPSVGGTVIRSRGGRTIENEVVESVGKILASDDFPDNQPGGVDVGASIRRP